MIVKRITKLLISAFLCFLFMPGGFSRAEMLNKIIAVVNEEFIAQSELDRILTPIYAQYKKLYAGNELLLKMDETRREVLTHMINDKLILSEARKREIEINPEDIERKLNALKAKFETEDEFQEALIKDNTTMKDVVEKFRSEILKEKFIASEVRANIVITPSEIKAHYDENLDKFMVPATVRVSNILIRKKENQDKNKALKRAEEVLGRLNKGADFSEMAKVYSEGTRAKEGGDMGYLAKGQLRKEFDEAIFSLERGEATEIIESNVGYHIFMVTEKKDPVVISLKEAHNKVRDVIYRLKAKEKFEEIITEIKKDAYISIK